MKTFLAFVILSLLSFPGFAKDKKQVVASVELSPAGSFEIVFPSVSGSIKKKGKGYVAKNIKVKVRKLKTGIKLRDDHTKKKFEAKKYKSIILSSGTASKGKGKAMLKVKGINKPILFKYTISGKFMKAVFDVKASDYQLKGIKYLGVGVKDIIKVKATIPIK